MSNTALDNIRVRIAPATNVKVRVQDNGSLQSVTPVTLKNAIGQNVTLTELFDVTITDPANSQILAYQSNTSQWINRTATTIAGNTGQITVANNNAFDFNLSLPNTVIIDRSLTVNTQFSTNSTGTYINNGFFGNVNISNATILTGTLQLQNIIPDANNVYTIGNNTNRFATLYLSGNTLYMGNVVFTDTNTSLSLTSSNGSPIAVSMGNTAVNGSLSVSTSFSANSLSANTLTINQTSNLAGNTTVGGDLNITGNINRNPNINLVLTGDISGSGNATLTNLGSVTITVNTIAQGNSVELGVDTTGSYVASLANGTGVFISNTSSGESEVPVIAIGQDVRTNSTVTFASANVTGDIRANNIIIGNGSITAAAPLTIGFPTGVGGPGSGIKVGEVDFFAFANAGSNRGAPTFRSGIANSTTVLRVLPNGVPSTNDFTTQTQFEFFAVDYFSNTTHWHNFRIIAQPNRFVIDTARQANTDAPRPIVFDIGGQGSSNATNANYPGVLVLSTDGRVGVNNQAPDAQFAVTGTANVSGNVRIAGILTAASNLQVTDTIAGNNMTLSGNLTVSGTTTYINTTALNVGDNIITLNADVTNVTAPTENAGIEINRGSSANVSFLWDETLDTWSQGNTTVAGYVNASSVNVTGSATVNGALTVNNTASFGNTTITGFVNATSVNVTGAATVNGAFIVNNTGSFGNTTITGFANVVGNVNVTNTLTSANLFANALSTNTFTTNLISVTTPATTANIAPTTGIAGWNYSGKFKSVAAEESNPLGLFLSPDGLNLYVNGSTGDDVNQYTLSTAWDISTATYVRVFSTSSQDTGPQDLFFKPDGLSMFIMGGNNDTVYQYTLSSAWDISTASYASKSFSVTTQEATPSGLWFKPDGTVMYIIGTNSDTVFQYTLGTPWDVSTASYASISFSVSAQESSPQQINLSVDGTKMWVIGTTGDDINEYNLGTAWNVGTATFVNNFYVGFQDASVAGLFIDSSAANRVYLVGTTSDTVYQYNTVTNSISANTDVFNTSNNARVQGNLAVHGSAVIDAALIAGNLTVGTTSISGTLTATSTISLSGSTTSTTTLGTAATTGTTTIGGTSQTGAIVVGQSTVSQTANIQAGATASGSTKTLNIGTAGLSGSITNLTLGSSVSGATTNTLLYSNTFIVTGGNTHLGGLIGGEAFRVIPTVNSNNYLQVAGAVTGAGPTLSAQGVDTNISINITGKGTGVVNISPSINVPGSATVNGAFVVNNTASLGNTTVTGFVNASASVNSAILSVGTSFIANSVGITTTGFANVATTVSIGANVIANTTVVFVGNSTVNATHSSSLLQVANSTSTTNVSANGVYVGGSYINSSAVVSANIVISSAGLDGQVALGDVTNGGIELGKIGRTSSGTPYIDFHSSASSPDYDVRIIASGGNTTSGSGNLSINANVVNLPNTVITGTIATGNATITGFVNATASVNSAILSVGTAVIANSTGITTTGFVNAAGVVNAASHTVGTSFIANSTGVTTTGFANVGGRIVGNLGGAEANTFAGVGLDINSAVIRVGDGQNSLTMANGTGFKIHDSGNSHKSIGQLGSTFYISDTSADGNSLFPATRTDIFAANTSLATLGVNTSVTGFINVSSTANVGGAITARGDVTVNGALTVANTAALGNTTITGFINVSSTANIGGALTARGAVTVNGALTVANTAALGNTTITGDATVTANLTANNVRTTGSVQIDGDLTVSGNTITIGVTNLAVSDNIIYLNEPETATVTSATSNGTAFIYTALNGFNVGQVVTVTGMTPGGYNAAANTITAANSTSFAVANTTAPGAYVSGGSAVARVDTNPDVGFAANYNDGTYRHAGFFRDATDGIFKVFDQYQPEPSGAFIDTSNNTFRIADFQSNNTTLSGNAYFGGTVGNETVRVATGTNTGKYTLLSSDTGNNFQLIGGIGTTNLGLYSTGGGNIRFYSAAGLVNEQLRIAHTASAVNYLQVTGAATGSGPTISAQGSDANVDINISSKGIANVNINTGSGLAFLIYNNNSGSVVNYWSVRGSNTTNLPVLWAQGSDTNVTGSITSKGSGAISIRTNNNNNEQFRVAHTASVVNYLQVTGAATGSGPFITAQGSDTDIPLTVGAKGSGILYIGGGQTRIAANNALALLVSSTGTAVNYIQLSTATTGFSPSYIARGTDTNIGLTFGTLNDANIDFQASGDPNAGTGKLQLRIAPVASAVNYIQLAGAATTGAPYVLANGSDTNVPLILSSKGTGSIQFKTAGATPTQFLVAHTASAVNYIQATGAVTGSGPILSAQGTDTNVDLNLAAKGTGNVVSNNNLTVVQQSNTTLKVWANTATTPVADLELQRGTTATWGGDAFTDYRLRSLGGNFILQSQNNATAVLDLLTVDEASNTIRIAPAGVEQFRVLRTASAVNYIQVAGNVTGQQPYFLSAGSDTNIGITYATKGTGPHFFSTGGGTLYQFEIASTASAVNYIRVTGAATSAGPVISAQGSDANIELKIQSKGASVIAFETHSNKRQLEVYGGTGTGANWIRITGSATTSPVSLNALGTDTNIDLALTPKGTGVVHSTTPLQVETDTVITTKTLTTTATTADQVVASFAGATYRSTQFIIQATDATGSKYQKTTILAVHNGTTAEHTEFGNINLGGDCGTFNVSYSGGNMVLTVTPASTNSTVFKVTCILTKV